MDMDVGLLAAFGAGILSFLSPCILPLVPPYLCFLAGTSLDELTEPGTTLAVTGRAFIRAFAFVIGFTLVFIALGAGASTLGRLVSEHLALLSRIAGLIIIILGLHMLGAFHWLLLMREARFTVSSRPVSVIGAFVVGLAFAFGWTPCVGPVLASVLMIAGTEDSISHGAGLLAAYATGIGVPFLGAALFTGPFLRWLSGFKRHLGIMEKVMGSALVGTGLLILMGAMPMVGGWLLENIPALGRIG
ncbi:cytochrome c biogenesis CcdA family protein [Microvirga rosea]|uniref:cytochrome c biogenesis CcdA family protein n=1 Tax=Microvirga rosea TaxID=2715425 RepID=UPI001D0BBC05|nr:cytochrome c biogenesis protein CcdA [Microvirga rosea]MCB8823501.1 cytochrome c biogenesis protein CcdA [Microvirga rosea]